AGLEHVAEANARGDDSAIAGRAVERHGARVVGGEAAASLVRVGEALAASRAPPDAPPHEEGERPRLPPRPRPPPHADARPRDAFTACALEHVALVTQARVTGITRERRLRERFTEISVPRAATLVSERRRRDRGTARGERGACRSCREDRHRRESRAGR